MFGMLSCERYACMAAAPQGVCIRDPHLWVITAVSKYFTLALPLQDQGAINVAVSPHRKATSIHPASHHWLKPGMFYNEPCVIGREELQSCWWCLVCSGSTAWQLGEQVCSNGHTHRPKPMNPWPISVVQDLGRPTPPSPIEHIGPLHKDSMRILII